MWVYCYGSVLWTWSCIGSYFQYAPQAAIFNPCVVAHQWVANGWQICHGNLITGIIKLRGHWGDARPLLVAWSVACITILTTSVWCNGLEIAVLRNTLGHYKVSICDLNSHVGISSLYMAFPWPKPLVLQSGSGCLVNIVTVKPMARKWGKI